ncbi:MAG: hypothetical protein KDH97_22185, partial [Calditrichaeota bacterium]|nr:hypothetical protein [Calditrichota bacterium]
MKFKSNLFSSYKREPAVANPWLKFVLLLLALILLFGCASDTSKRIVIWSSLRPVERDFLQQKLEEFNQRYPEYQFQQLYYQTEELRPNYMVSAL